MLPDALQQAPLAADNSLRVARTAGCIKNECGLVGRVRPTYMTGFLLIGGQSVFASNIDRGHENGQSRRNRFDGRVEDHELDARLLKNISVPLRRAVAVQRDKGSARRKTTKCGERKKRRVSQKNSHRLALRHPRLDSLHQHAAPCEQLAVSHSRRPVMDCDRTRTYRGNLLKMLENRDITKPFSRRHKSGMNGQFARVRNIGSFDPCQGPDEINCGLFS